MPVAVENDLHVQVGPGELTGDQDNIVAHELLGARSERAFESPCLGLKALPDVAQLCLRRGFRHRRVELRDGAGKVPFRQKVNKLPARGDDVVGFRRGCGAGRDEEQAGNLPVGVENDLHVQVGPGELTGDQDNIVVHAFLGTRPESAFESPCLGLKALPDFAQLCLRHDFRHRRVELRDGAGKVSFRQKVNKLPARADDVVGF